MIFQNGKTKLDFDLETGMFSISQEKPNIEFVKNAHSMVNIKFKSINNGKEKDFIVKCKSTDQYERSFAPKKQENGKAITIVHQNCPNKPDFLLEFILLDDKPEIFIRILLKNSLSRPFGVVSFHPLYLDEENDGELYIGDRLDYLKIFKQGWQSWSKSTIIDGSDSTPLPRTNIAKKVYTPYKDKDRKKAQIGSENYINLNVMISNYNFLFGFVTLKDQFCQILLNFNKKKNKIKSLNCRSLADDFILEQNDELDSEKIVVLFDNSNQQFLNLSKYMDMVASFNNAITWKKVPIGWCSWYHYFDKITEKDCLKNLEFISQNKERIPIDFFQIDDGYQIRAGDWEINHKFPSGMKFLADKIREKGYIPGLWLAPFLISTKSALIKDHPDWFLKDKKGKFVQAHMEGFEAVSNRLISVLRTSSYALDCTNPEAQEWLKNLFNKVCNEWGYKYIKIDFIYAAALEAVHHDNKYTRAQAYRKGLEVIREAVGDDVFILGCGAPLAPAIGIVNGMRVSCDTAPVWDPFLRKLAEKGINLQAVPSVFTAMQNNLVLSFLHKKIWLNDPDCLMIRDQDTKLSEDEVRTQITIIGLTNGIYMLSDDFATVSSNRIDYIKKFLPLDKNIGTAIPIDLYEVTQKIPPSIYSLDINLNDTWKVVAVINWSGKPKDINLDLEKLGLDDKKYYHVYDFWNQDYHGNFTNSILLENIEKHGCRLLKIIETSKDPVLISSSFHFTQGAEMNNIIIDGINRKIVINTKIPGENEGMLTFYSEKTIKQLKINSDAIETEHKIVNPIITIKLKFKDELNLNITYLY